MKQLEKESNEERLYLKALSIQHERSVGLWLPIMWHLALRGHAAAMIDLAAWFSEGNSLDSFGEFADSFSAAGLYRRAWRKGDARAAQHLATSCFNRNDLIGYRQWLRRAAAAGDNCALHEVRHFETRLPHSAARKIGRWRPNQKRDEVA
jgi:hypothetical protein